MRKSIKEWGIALAIAMLLLSPGVMLEFDGAEVSLVSTAFANGETAQEGRTPAKGEDGYWYKWKTIFALGNTVGYCNPNGETSVLRVAFTNTGDAVVDIWIQDAEKSVTGTPGAFANVISAAIVFNPNNSDDYRWAGNVHGGPCWRVHSADTDLGAADGVGVKIKLHNRR